MSVRKRMWTSGGAKRMCWVADFRDQSGNRVVKSGFRTKAEALAHIDDKKPEIRAGTFVPENKSITVKRAAEIWIEAVRNGSSHTGRDAVEASTLRQYRSHVDYHIVPLIGDEKLARLTRARMVEFKDELLANVSRPLARKVLASLRSIFAEAQYRGKMAADPLAGIKISEARRDNYNVVVPDIDDIKAILTVLDEMSQRVNDTKSAVRAAKSWRRWRALIATAVYTGLRASELRGLPWEAVDLEAGTITVWQRADENGRIGPPKTTSGRRTVHIPLSLVALLKAWKIECSPGPLVFPNGNGNPESLANIFNRAWKPVQIMAGVTVPKRDAKGKVARGDDGKPVLLPKYNFHLLRHFHASAMIADDTNPKEVQAHMGHSSIQITYDLYGHLFRDEAAEQRRRDRADRLAGLLA